MPHSEPKRRFRVTIEGPPASGKTTLMALLTNLLRREFSSMPLTVDTMGLGPWTVPETTEDARLHLPPQLAPLKWGALDPMAVDFVERQAEKPQPASKDHPEPLDEKLHHVAEAERQFRQQAHQKRRQLMQQIITHPDAFADLLLLLLDRVELSEWVRRANLRVDGPTSVAEVRAETDTALRALLQADPITGLPR